MNDRLIQQRFVAGLLLGSVASTRQAVVMAALLLTCRAAGGEVVHFQMTGHITIDFQVGELPDGIHEGAPFQVDLSYDTATLDYYPDDPQRALYQTVVGPDNYLVLRAGPAEMRAIGLRIATGNDVDGWPHVGDGRKLWELPDDSIQMFTSPFTANFPLPTYHSIQFRWRDPTRNAFDSDSLPELLNPSMFNDLWFELSTASLYQYDNQFTARAVVAEIRRVPEPSSLGAATWAILVSTPLGRWKRRRSDSLVHSK